jgi:hypothetical protein
MTTEESRRIQSFLARFNRVDTQLRRKLGLSRRDGTFNSVVTRFTRTYPNVVDADVLYTLAAIRNALVHEALSESEYCVVPTHSVSQQLDELLDQLVAPARVIPTFRQKVETLTPEDALTNVLEVIKRRDFSQFPRLQELRVCRPPYRKWNYSMARWMHAREFGSRFEQRSRSAIATTRRE